MNNSYARKINTLFVIEIIVAIFGIATTILCFIIQHIRISVIDYDGLATALMLIQFGITPIIISIFVEKKWPCVIGVFLIFFAFWGAIISIKLQVFNLNVFSVCITGFIIVFFISILIFAFTFRNRKLLELENERKARELALENERKKKNFMSLIEQFSSQCRNDNNLWDLMSHFSEAIKNIELYESLPMNDSEKILIANYKNELISNKQAYIEKAILEHYKIIYDAIETKQIYLSKKIYNATENLRYSINKHSRHFGENNRNLASLILEKTDLITNFIKKYIDASCTDIKHNFDEMKGQDFEKYCAYLLTTYGFVDVEVTRGSGDQGVDIIGTYNNVKHAIQCKRYSHKLGNTPIQEVAAGKNYYNCQTALVITNNFFTESAIELAKANNVVLWDRQKLLQLIYFTDNKWKDLLENLKIKM